VIRVSPSLQGTYTINNSGTGSADFTSFSDAADALNFGSISGAVVFNIAPSTYSEHIILGPVKGTSDKNTITFQGMDKDSTKDTITWKTDNINLSGNSYIIKLTSAHDIIFKGMTFHLPGSNAANAVECIGSLHNITFLHNNFNADSLSSGVHINMSSGMDSSIIFKDNIFYGGSMGLYFINNITSSHYGIFTLDSICSFIKKHTVSLWKA
jgi:hypothetical protein